MPSLSSSAAAACCPNAAGMIAFTPQGGGQLPAIGYGTAHIMDSTTILAALEAGYRHIDTALLYGNHGAVGEALSRSGLDRSEVFLTSKISFSGKGGELEAVRKSTAELGVAQMDLCLLHTPLTGSWSEFLAAFLPHRFGRFQPASWKLLRHLAWPARRALRALAALLGPGATAAAEKRLAAWRELESARAAGLCRYIGVSNFDAGLLEELAARAEVLPAVNQIELHPRFQAKETVAFCRSRGIAVVGYGNGVSREMSEAVQIAAAREWRSSPAQITIAWTLQTGAGVVVRSARPAGIAENFAASKLSLRSTELELLDAADEELPFYWDVSAVARVTPEVRARDTPEVAGSTGRGDGVGARDDL